MQEEKNTGAVPTGQTVSTGSTGRGGRRTGAGRKPKQQAERNIAVSFSLPPEIVQRLRQVPDKSRLIQQLLREYFDI